MSILGVPDTRPTRGVRIAQASRLLGRSRLPMRRLLERAGGFSDVGMG
jgi:hypothetical protein